MPAPGRENPLPTQMCSNSPKAAVAQLKKAEGIYAFHKKKFAMKGDIDNFMIRLFKKLVINGLDTISCCDFNAMGASSTPSTTAAPIKMMSVSEHCILFNLTDMKAEKRRVFPTCNMHDEQNDKEAIDCLMNSLEETLCKQIRVKLEENMLFTDAEMLFVKTVRPWNS